MPSFTSFSSPTAASTTTTLSATQAQARCASSPTLQVAMSSTLETMAGSYRTHLTKLSVNCALNIWRATDPLMRNLMAHFAKSILSAKEMDLRSTHERAITPWPTTSSAVLIQDRTVLSSKYDVFAM